MTIKKHLYKKIPCNSLLKSENLCSSVLMFHLQKWHIYLTRLFLIFFVSTCGVASLPPLPCFRLFFLLLSQLGQLPAHPAFVLSVAF